MSFTMEKSASRIHATAKDLRFVRGFSVFEGFLEIFMQKAKELRDSDVSGK